MPSTNIAGIDPAILQSYKEPVSPLDAKHTGATIGTLLANTKAVNQATEQSAAKFPAEQAQAAATLESTQQQMKRAQSAEAYAEKLREFNLHSAELNLTEEKLRHANLFASAIDFNNDPEVVVPQWQRFREKALPLRIMPEELLPEDATYNQMLDARRYIQNALDSDIPKLKKQTAASGVFLTKLAEVEKRFPDLSPQDQYDMAAAYSLSARGIEHAGEKSTVTTTASETARLQPGITTKKTKQVAIQTAVKVQQLKVDAANAALVALPPKDKTGKYDTTHLTPQVAYELAMACAKLVSPQGTVAQNTAEELYQRTITGDMSKALAYLSIPGVKVAGTTEQNIANIENFIRREGGLAESNRTKLLKGELPELSKETGGGAESDYTVPTEEATTGEGTPIDDLDLDALKQ
jgi:hypothetical protein